MRAAIILIFLLFVAPASAEQPGSIFDVLNLTVFDGNWSVISDDVAFQDRCNFPGKWYLLTSVGSRYNDGDLWARASGLRWDGCRSYKFSDGVMNSKIYNHSDWCEKVYYPYVITERSWNAQPQYTKAILNNTTKFMGVVPNRWDLWHPYLGRPDDMPVYEVSNSEHIFGWVTVSFENASRINGTTYVADNYSIVPVYDVWNSVDGIKAYERCEDCYSCKMMRAKLISMNVTPVITEKDELIVVNVYVELKWGYYCNHCRISGENMPCEAMWRNTTEHARFTATAIAPTIVTLDDRNVIAQITEHNNTFDPYTIIRVDVPENVTVTTFTYKNNTVKHFNLIGVSNVSHVEYLDSSTWKTTPNQDLILPYGDLCLIRDAPLNLSELQIQISTPYITKNVTRCNITVITGESTDYVDFKGIFMYTSIIFILVLCAWLNLRRFHR